MADRHYLEQLTKKLADDGKLVEAGWMSLRIMALPLDAGAAQVGDMRMAFMCGAQHLFASMMMMLDPGVRETEADLTRMELIDAELEAFGEELKRKFPRRT